MGRIKKKLLKVVTNSDAASHAYLPRSDSESTEPPIKISTSASTPATREIFSTAPGALCTEDHVQFLVKCP